jgi:hypothetical protein
MRRSTEDNETARGASVTEALAISRHHLMRMRRARAALRPDGGRW